MKTRKILWWLLVTAMFCAVTTGGCGGSDNMGYIINPNTQSKDVTPTPTPTSPDVTPTPTPTSQDVTPTPTPTPTSPDVTPTPTPTPASQDITPTPTPTPTDSTAATPSESTLNVNDTATASKVLSAVGGAGSDSQVAALPDEAVGTERSLEDVDPSDLAGIPSNETPALALPIMRVSEAAVYVWGLDLSSLNAGDSIVLHMMPESTANASGFSAAADEDDGAAADSYAFLDDSGNKITTVPASKKVNVAAYMEPAYTYAPVITVRDSGSETPSESEDVTPVVPVVPTPSEDVTPLVPTSPDVAPDVPTPPTSGDTPPDVPTPPTSGDTPPDVPTPPTSGDTPPDAPNTPTSGDTTPSTEDTTSGDVTPTEDEDITGETYTSSTAFENALVVNGSTSTYTNITVNKTGDASGQSENYDWYGTNAAVLAQGGANVTISGSSTTIHSNAVGGNAVFAYGGNSGMNTNNSGDGTKITISDATITTESRNSGGIMVTGGGIIEASNLTITTAEGSSAAIRSDRGGGTINVTGGTYTTNGTGSPAIYSTAAITGNDVTLQSNVAQVVVIEGGNSVTLTDSTLVANHTTLNGQDTTHQAVLIYQSQSGDASSGSSAFTMAGGSLTNSQGDIFHVTNTTTTITLSESIAITNNDSAGAFLRASSDSWGSSGNNGGKVILNADGQTIEGDMIIDSVSTLALNMSNSSIFKGAINTSGQTGTVSVVIDSSSTWTLTGNSYVTSLTNNGTINTGSYTLYVNGVAYSN